MGPTFLRPDVEPGSCLFPALSAPVAKSLLFSALCFLTIPEDIGERKILIFLMTQIILALEIITNTKVLSDR